jgi:hypothetical protein
MCITVHEKQTFMSSSILATCDWMLPMISLSGDIVGYLPSSHTNLHAYPQTCFRATRRTKHPYIRSRSAIGLESIAGSSRPGEVGVDGDAIDGESPALDPSGTLEVLDLPPDLVRHALDEDVGLRGETESRRIEP